MLSRLHRPAQRADVNWAPLSEVMVAGTPKCDTQPAKRALAQSAEVGGDGGERDGLRPSRCPVDDGGQVGVAARRRQRPDQVHMEVGETALRYRYLCRLQVDVSVNFAPLALQADPGHLGNGLGHLWPAEPGGDEAPALLGGV
jgi:hypothetical protein